MRKSLLPRENPTSSVLIVRLGAMGDVLHAMPAIAALRALHPQWRIGWIIEPRWAPLLRATPEAAPRSPQMPLVDRVYEAHARGWARAPFARSTRREIAALRGALRADRYDLAVDLQGALRSALIGRLPGVRLIGEARPREAPAKWFFHQRAKTRGVHVIEQAREVVEAALGAPLSTPLPPLPYDDEAERWAGELAAGSPLALINPGAGWGAKRWPAERYGDVARALAERKGFLVLINAGPGEETVAQQVAESSGGTARPLSMTLNQLIALTRRAAIVLAGDTGPLHLASALGRPVVGVFGPTDPARNGPFGAPFRVLRHPESRRDHTRRSLPEAGLLNITADEVLAAADSLLEQVACRA